MLKKIALLFLAPVVRAALQVAAGSEVVDEDTQSKVVGSVLFLGTVAWSIYEKRKASSIKSDGVASP